MKTDAKNTRGLERDQITRVLYPLELVFATSVPPESLVQTTPRHFKQPIVLSFGTSLLQEKKKNSGEMGDCVQCMASSRARLCAPCDKRDENLRYSNVIT